MRSPIGLAATIACISFGFHAANAHAESLNDEVAEWVEREAVTLSTTEPDAPTDELSSLSEAIGDARIVAFGEPTHGNREIFQLKRRVFQYLVEDKGFSVFALEAPFAETERLDAYVQGGAGSASDALAGLTMWAWDTEELVDFLDWIREYNRQPETEAKIRIYGFDIQAPERAAREMLRYLEKFHPELESEIAAELGSLAIPFSDPDEWGWRPVIATESDAAAMAMAERAVSIITADHDRHFQHGTLREWERALQMSQQVLWWIEANAGDASTYNTVRDRSMAANLDWIMKREGAATKAFVWAHNSHVADAHIERWGNVDTFGRHARRLFGHELKIIGGLFGHGEITAVTPDKISTFIVASPRPNSLESLLSESGHEIMFLDLDRIPTDGEVHRYFNQPQETFHSGGGYSDEDTSRYFMNYRLAEAFDILAFVRLTTPSRTIEPTDYASVPILSRPANLDFERGSLGDVPRNWFAWSKMRRWGYSSTTEPAVLAQEGQVGRLCGDEHRLNPDASGSLIQRISALSYRGSRVVLAGKARTEGVGSDGTAFVRLKVLSSPAGDVHSAQNTLTDTLDSIDITSEDWSDFEVLIDIPQDANSIILGIFLNGAGCAFVDDLRIAPVN